MRAGQISGALNHALAESIDYGNTRVQFGRPIGKFQAIQHLVAEQAGEAAAAKAAVQLALRAMDDAPSWQAAAVAKIRAGLAVEPVSAVAHAVHGAIGVTEEHMLHHTTRRLWQWRDEAGDDRHEGDLSRSRAVGRRRWRARAHGPREATSLGAPVGRRAAGACTTDDLR